jgi:hypothetical protein
LARHVALHPRNFRSVALFALSFCLRNQALHTLVCLRLSLRLSLTLHTLSTAHDRSQ